MPMSEYYIVHPDGTTEKVILKPVEEAKPTMKDHIMIAYFVVGIIALGLSGYVTYKRLNK